MVCNGNTFILLTEIAWLSHGKGLMRANSGHLLEKRPELF
jgi:hypothetical protein